jgi:hypothetical protein
MTPETPFGNGGNQHPSLLLDSPTRSSQQPQALPQPPASSLQPPTTGHGSVWRVATVLVGGAVLGSVIGYILISWLMARGL